MRYVSRVRNKKDTQVKDEMTDLPEFERSLEGQVTHVARERVWLKGVYQVAVAPCENKRKPRFRLSA